MPIRSLTPSMMALGDRFNEMRRAELEEEAQDYAAQFRNKAPSFDVLSRYGKMPMTRGMQQTAADPRAMADGDTARPPGIEAFQPGGQYYGTETGRAFGESQALTDVDVGDPKAVAKALMQAGMTKEAMKFLEATTGTGGGAQSVWELQGEIGGEELSEANSALLDQYAKGELLLPEEAQAMKVINQRRPYDVSEWLKVLAQTRGKAFAGIPGAVAKEDALRDPKAKTAAATAAGGTAAKIQTERGLADMSGETAAIKTGATEEAKRLSKLKAGTGKAEVNWAKVQNLMKNIWDRKKEQLGDTGAGLLVGGAKVALGKAKLPGGEATAKYEGQRTETAMALNSILTGQNRLIEGIFHRIAATLPDELDPKGYAIPKIEQSLRNSFGLIKAMKMNGLLDEEFLQQHEVELPGGEIGVSDAYEARVARLAPAPLEESEEQEIRKIVNYVLGADSPYATGKTQSGKPSTLTDAEWEEYQALEKKYGK